MSRSQTSPAQLPATPQASASNMSTLNYSMTFRLRRLTLTPPQHLYSASPDLPWPLLPSNIYALESPLSHIWTVLPSTLSLSLSHAFDNPNTTPPPSSNFSPIPPLFQSSSGFLIRLHLLADVFFAMSQEFQYGDTSLGRAQTLTQTRRKHFLIGSHRKGEKIKSFGAMTSSPLRSTSSRTDIRCFRFSLEPMNAKPKAHTGNTGRQHDRRQARCKIKFVEKRVKI